MRRKRHRKTLKILAHYKYKRGHEIGDGRLFVTTILFSGKSRLKQADIESLEKKISEDNNFDNCFIVGYQYM